MVKKRKRAFNKTSVILTLAIIASFVVGLISSNLLPINYQQKLEKIYTKNKPEENYIQTYVSLDKGVTFNYPSNFSINPGLYSPNFRNKRYIIKVSRGSVQFYLYRYNLDKTQTLIDFAENLGLFTYQELREIEYKRTNFKGNEAITAEFKVTEEQKEIEVPHKGGVSKAILEPVGYKGRLLYIKHGEYVYIWKAGNPEIITKDFDLITESFDFI